MAYEIETVTLPAHWACYIANADTGGLCEAEIGFIDQYTEDMESLHVGDGEPFFAWGGDYWFDEDVRGGDVIEYTYLWQS